MPIESMFHAVTIILHKNVEGQTRRIVAVERPGKTNEWMRENPN